MPELENNQDILNALKGLTKKETQSLSMPSVFQKFLSQNLLLGSVSLINHTL